jgi:phosphatidate cytidylyltransferase
MLKWRFISAVIGIIFFIIFIFWGSLPFYFLILIITLFEISEYNNIVFQGSRKNLFFLGFFSLIILSYTYLNSNGYIRFSVANLFLLIFISLFIYYISFNNYKGILQNMCFNLFGLIYIVGGMSFFILLRDFDLKPFDNTKALWLVLLTTWATDTGAYFVGRFIGKNKLAKNISPNKTIEGVFGGIFSSIIVAFLLSSFYGLFSFYWVIYGILIGVIAIVGDLFESSIKRDMGVKDFGYIIPGHGGMLDRFDSLLFTVPFTYHFICLII